MTKQFLINNFPVDLHKKLKMYALENNMTLANAVIKAITEFLKK